MQQTTFPGYMQLREEDDIYRSRLRQERKEQSAFEIGLRKLFLWEHYTPQGGVINGLTAMVSTIRVLSPPPHS